MRVLVNMFDFSALLSMSTITLRKNVSIVKCYSIWTKLPQCVSKIFPNSATFGNNITKTIVVQNMLKLQDPYTSIEIAYQSAIGYCLNMTPHVLSQPNEQAVAIFIPSSLHRYISL